MSRRGKPIDNTTLENEKKFRKKRSKKYNRGDDDEDDEFGSETI